MPKSPDVEIRPEHILDQKMHHVHGVCHECGANLDKWLPVEPVYTIAVAAMLLNVSSNQLLRYLNRHKAEFPPLYGTYKRRYHRLLTARDVRRLASQRRYTQRGKRYRLDRIEKS